MTNLRSPLRGLFLESLELKGKVFSGRGEGAKFIQLPWVQEQFLEKARFTPFKGTLNLKLSGKDVILRRKLEVATSLRIRPEAGYCEAKLYLASIRNLECAVVIPQVEDYPEDVLEVVSPVDLKKELRVRDKDEICVRVIL